MGQRKRIENMFFVDNDDDKKNPAPKATNGLPTGAAAAIMQVGMSQEDQGLEQLLDWIRKGISPVPNDPDQPLRVACICLDEQKQRINRTEESDYLDMLVERYENDKAKVAAVVGEKKLATFLKTE